MGHYELDDFSEKEIVQQVLAEESDQYGDKYADLIKVSDQNYYYVSGPIKDENNNILGVIMVGNLVQNLLDDIRKETVAHISTYDFDGQIISSTFSAPVEVNKNLSAEIVAKQNQQTIVRDFSID